MYYYDVVAHFTADLQRFNLDESGKFAELHCMYTRQSCKEMTDTFSHFLEICKKSAF